jgi:predicted nucleic acid-binding protein
VDANIVIAAFLRDSTVRRLLSLSFLDLMAPEFLHEEVAKHLPDLAQRARLERTSAEQVLIQLNESLTWIPQDSTLNEWKRAAAAMAGIDSGDIPYVAAALASRSDGIWSDDPDMKQQTLVPCWTTKELVAALRNEGFDF